MAVAAEKHSGKLVVRNTFLEFADDSPSLDNGSPAVNRRPRAQTDNIPRSKAISETEDHYYGGGAMHMGGYPASFNVGMPGGVGDPFGFNKASSDPYGLGDPAAAAAYAAMADPMAAAAWWQYNAALAYGLPPQGMPYPFPPPYFDPNLLEQQGFGQRERKTSGIKVKRNVIEKQSPQHVGTNSPSPSTAERPVGGEHATTVMLRNIPNRYTQTMLVELVQEQGFQEVFDFVYLPMDFRNGVNLGYAFVNLATHADAINLTNLLQGFTEWSCDSSKVCEVSWAHPHQGLDEHVERYRNSPVMHQCMPEEYKPMMFKNGVQLPFPPPTKPIRAPKLRPARDRSELSGDQGKA